MAKARPDDPEQPEHLRYLEHLKCRGLSRRCCVCQCHPENRAGSSPNADTAEGVTAHTEACTLCHGTGKILLVADEDLVGGAVEIDCPERFGLPLYFCVVHRNASRGKPELVFGYVNAGSPEEVIEHVRAERDPSEPLCGINVYPTMASYVKGEEPLARWEEM